MNTNEKKITKRRLPSSSVKLLLSTLLLLLGIVYDPLLQVCLGATAVLAIQGIFSMDSRVKESIE